MEVSMLGRRKHKGRAKDIFVRQAKGRGRVAIRICSWFVLSFLMALVTTNSPSWSVEVSGGFARYQTMEYDGLGSRITATAAEGARAEAADTSRTICWRPSRLA
jgi:hypothetical protein